MLTIRALPLVLAIASCGAPGDRQNESAVVGSAQTNVTGTGVVDDQPAQQEDTCPPSESVPAKGCPTDSNGPQTPNDPAEQPIFPGEREGSGVIDTSSLSYIQTIPSADWEKVDIYFDPASVRDYGHFRTYDLVNVFTVTKETLGSSRRIGQMRYSRERAPKVACSQLQRPPREWSNQIRENQAEIRGVCEVAAKKVNGDPDFECPSCGTDLGSM